MYLVDFGLYCKVLCYIFPVALSDVSLVPRKPLLSWRWKMATGGVRGRSSGQG